MKSENIFPLNISYFSGLEATVAPHTILASRDKVLSTVLRTTQSCVTLTPDPHEALSLLGPLLHQQVTVSNGHPMTSREESHLSTMLKVHCRCVVAISSGNLSSLELVTGIVRLVPRHKVIHLGPTMPSQSGLKMLNRILLWSKVFLYILTCTIHFLLPV